MQIPRTSLIEKLETIAPALSTINIVPVLTHFWFRGTEVMAYNDQIGISVPLKTEFKGTLPGLTLLQLLKNSRAKDVDMILEQDNTCLVKAASSKIRLAYMTPDAFQHPPIKSMKAQTLPLDFDEFVEGIKMCLRCVSQDTSVADQLGVTFMPGKDWLDLYATNYHTMMHARVKLMKAFPIAQRFIMSKPFCEQLIKLADKTMTLELQDDELVMQCGKVNVCGGLIRSDKPLQFPDLFAQEMPKKLTLAPIPSKLDMVLARACIITEAKDDRTKTAITVQDGKMKLVSRSESKGEIVDYVQLTHQQPSVSLSVEPRRLKDGLDVFKQMQMTNNCVIMRQGAYTYLVSANEE